MTLHYEDAGLRLFHGKNMDVLPTMPDASYDSIVTDPPYELGFMGKGWDSTGIAYDVNVWRECSMDVATAVDKLDAAAERRTRALTFTAWMRAHLTAQQINEITGTAMGTHFITDKQQPSIATADLFDQLRPYLPTVPEEIEQLVADRTVESANWAAREVTGQHDKPAAANAWRANVVGGAVKAAREKRDRAFTPEAQAWQGWGTALKPALEPIIVARKPFKGTVAANLLAHGTSAINVDACRIPFASDADRRESTEKNQHAKFGTKPGGNKVYGDYSQTETKDYDGTKGRWPTNIVLTHQPAVDPESGDIVGDACADGCVDGCPVAELGDSARFYPAFRYEPKAKDSERPEVDGVEHATVKPLGLMQWLVRLITRPGGRVLDLYAGSGTTGEAALLEGMEVDLIELEDDHLPLILARVRKPLQPSIFGAWEGGAA